MKTVTNPIWWRRRTALQGCRTLESIFACIAVAWLVSGLAEAVDPAKLCLTDECVHSASALLNKIKRTLNPCNNFYKFACGNYLDTTTIPEDKGYVNSFSAVEDTLREQLKAIIKKKQNETDLRHYRLPAAFFNACMNEDFINTLSCKDLQEIAEEVGGWPVNADGWDSDESWNWQDAVKKSRRLGLSINSILSVSVGVNLKNNTMRFIQLDQPTLGLKREYLVKGFNDSLVLAYYSYMVDLAVLFGAEPAKAERELKESITFEMKLAQISWSTAKRSNYSAMYNLRTIKQLQELYQHIQWLDYINALLPEGLQVDENEVINLAVPSFFNELDKLLSQTNKRIIANHMMCHTYNFAVDYLSEKFRSRKMKFITALTGKQKRAARWVECVDDVTKRFSVAVGSQFVQKHFKLEYRNVAMEIVRNIKNAFREMLEEAEWVDDTTKRKAIHKLDLMHTRMGYPSELLDDTILEEYYRGLKITDPDNYLKSSLMLNIFDDDNTFKTLRLPVNRTGWTTFTRPAMVNAYYSDTENSITFPAGILQGQFFNGNRLKSINFGAIGTVIAHEISHGFDNIGRQFDGYGNLVNGWDNVTEQAYFERANCLIEQYSNYTDEQVGLKLNGINTQSENIADNAGVKAAYLAYTHCLAEQGDELRLPISINHTPQQLFWISAAQLWCAQYSDEDLKTSITTRIHSPSQYRVLGPFSNMNTFSSDFNCAEGTPMNPVKKCGVW